jgi:hypothetical protein
MNTKIFQGSRFRNAHNLVWKHLFILCKCKYKSREEVLSLKVSFKIIEFVEHFRGFELCIIEIDSYMRLLLLSHARISKSPTLE